MTKQRGLGLLACMLFAVAIAAGSISCSSKKSGGPVGPGPTKELNSGDIAGSGGTFVHTFNTAGTFNYHCERHLGLMPGTVTVTAGTPVVDDNITITSTSPFPAKSIKVGAKITWTNNTAMPHTVTSD